MENIEIRENIGGAPSLLVVMILFPLLLATVVVVVFAFEDFGRGTGSCCIFGGLGTDGITTA